MDKGAQNLDEKQCPREWPKDEVAEGDETWKEEVGWNLEGQRREEEDAGT
jgi:hypothetical protein